MLAGLVAGVSGRRARSVDPELGEALVIDAQVVGQLVDDRDPDFVGEVVGVREVLLEREAEEDDPIGDRGAVCPQSVRGMPSYRP